MSRQVPYKAYCTHPKLMPLHRNSRMRYMSPTRSTTLGAYTNRESETALLAFSPTAFSSLRRSMSTSVAHRRLGAGGMKFRSGTLHDPFASAHSASLSLDATCSSPRTQSSPRTPKTATTAITSSSSSSGGGGGSGKCNSPRYVNPQPFRPTASRPREAASAYSWEPSPYDSLRESQLLHRQKQQHGSTSHHHHQHLHSRHHHLSKGQLDEYCRAAQDRVGRDLCLDEHDVQVIVDVDGFIVVLIRQPPLLNNSHSRSQSHSQSHSRSHSHDERGAESENMRRSGADAVMQYMNQWARMDSAVSKDSSRWGIEWDDWRLFALDPRRL
ncbi:putative mitochondrial protein [Andalucia godoyi]|uniref:Putative mitochondrial protein n=1 Tax=Andalucia godoyi TaxID=505711 RepID=A0A8K0F4B7_ANDGO|nr:putative mitochondrial protein [Andalucia godoyi]|eukprot:ANDGO_00797.mRNA.1 putative mitochondrial protein